MIKEKCEFTHFYEHFNNKNLVLYKHKERKSKRIETPYDTQYPFAVAQIRNDLYFTGGGNYDKDILIEKFFKTATRVKVCSKDMDTLAEGLPDMHIARTKHSMAIVNNSSVYVVGGFNSNGIIDTCEEFEIEKGVWKNCASLNERRIWVSLIVIEPRHIYAFGGERDKASNGSKAIEYLDTNNKKAKLWVKVALSSGSEVWPEISLAGGFRLSEQNIIIFGGKVNKSEINYSFIFNIPTQTMKKDENLACNDVFLMTRPVVSGNDLIVIGKNEGHKYNLFDRKWSLLKKETLTPIAGFFVKADTV